MNITLHNDRKAVSSNPRYSSPAPVFPRRSPDELGFLLIPKPKEVLECGRNLGLIPLKEKLPPQAPESLRTEYRKTLLAQLYYTGSTAVLAYYTATTTYLAAQMLYHGEAAGFLNTARVSLGGVLISSLFLYASLTIGDKRRELLGNDNSSVSKHSSSKASSTGPGFFHTSNSILQSIGRGLGVTPLEDTLSSAASETVRNKCRRMHIAQLACTGFAATAAATTAYAVYSATSALFHGNIPDFLTSSGLSFVYLFLASAYSFVGASLGLKRESTIKTENFRIRKEQEKNESMASVTQKLSTPHLFP